MKGDAYMMLVLSGIVGATINILTLHFILAHFFLTKWIVKTTPGKVIMDVFLPGFAVSVVAATSGLGVACMLLTATAIADVIFVWCPVIVYKVGQGIAFVLGVFK